jgi:hypothetical protein
VGQALLWAGPLGVAASAFLLLAAAPWFRHEPGVPSAGDERAWGVLWGALALSGLGCAIGALSAVTWWVRAARDARRPTRLEWVRTALNLLLGAGVLLLFLAP